MNVQRCSHSPAVENDAGPGKMAFVCVVHQVKLLGDEAMLAGWIQIVRVSHQRGRSSNFSLRLNNLGIMSAQIVVPQIKYPTPILPCVTLHTV